MNNSHALIKKLSEIFGSYRAEWLKGNIFNLFIPPCYFAKLEDSRPHVLQGGRGSGKTTALQGLSYQGQFAYHKANIKKFDESTDYIGLYHRVDTNHVRAFVGNELNEDRWSKIFSHYFNLLVCNQILDFLQWHMEKSPCDKQLASDECVLIGKSLKIRETCDSFSALLKYSESAMYEFQANINDIVDYGGSMHLSLAGAPIKLLTEYAVKLPHLKGKVIYILIDEYENFEDYQQIVVNSLLKHCSSNYTFKIGVREMGWRVTHTYNPNEHLQDPADYILFKIEKELVKDNFFGSFAKDICQQRIKKLITEQELKSAYDIATHLKSFSYEEEALELGVENTEYVKSVRKSALYENSDLKDRPLLFLFLIGYWAKVHNQSIDTTITDCLVRPVAWNTRYGNYKFEMLFKIRKGRGSVGIQKYYAGWDTFILLAGGNIRYLMELVYRSYEQHLQCSTDIMKPISPQTQTEAAMEIGRKNIMQLESLWKGGAQLTRLLFGMGRVFNTLAREDAKHAPEINQFTIENSRETSKPFDEFINAAVMNLALVREYGTKLGETETKDFTYSIHPIYAPFFIFSHRRKRKIILKEDQIWGVINNPQQFIPKILKSRNVIEEKDSNSPYETFDLFGDI
jgi:hypothetical protein